MPKATVAAILLSPTAPSRVLLTLRTIEPFKGQWCLPGGHIEEDEPVLDAIVREVKEETGLDFTPQFLGWFDEIFPDLNVHHVVLVFHGTAQGSVSIQPEEVAEAKWVELETARKMELAFGHGRVLETFDGRA